MSFAETARLITELDMKNNMTGPTKQAIGQLDTLNKKVGVVQIAAGTALGNAFTSLGRLAFRGVKAAVGAVGDGIESLAELEDATTSVDGAIKQMGLTGKLTSAQVADWANQIESDVQAAFDDKAITAAAATLIRFGHVTPATLKPALVVMTDLATKTGDVDSAAGLLAKALADPEKAAGKLAKAGVILTDQQQAQIKAMTAAGDVAGAQTVLLDALSSATKGAAAASAGPFRDAQNTLKDVIEDVQRALAIGFLPVLEEVSGLLKGKLADKSFLADVETFGKNLAGYLQDAIDAAKQIPWQSIKDAMSLAGQGAKAALDLFTGLPPWVQTAVVTGWGLNKLTGGALSSIVTQLGTGLIKGVLGMNAAVVNITAGTVNGGVPGAGGAGGALSGLGAGLGAGALLIGLDQLAGSQREALKTALATTPLTLDEKSRLNASGFAPLIGKLNDPVVQALLPMLPQLKALASDIGDVGDSVDGNTRAVNSLAGTAPGTPHTSGVMPHSLEPPSATRTADGVDELKRINQQASNQLGTMVGELKTLPSGLSSMIDKWAGAHDAAIAAGFKAGTAAIKQEIASKLGLTVKELGHLREAFRSALSSELGITTGELRHLNRTFHFDEDKIAAKLGISVEQLRALKDEARTTAANTTKIKNKDWTPTINVATTVKSSFSVSARTVATEVQRYDWTGRKRVD